MGVALVMDVQGWVGVREVGVRRAESFVSA